MNDPQMTPEQQELLNRFLQNNKMFYAPDPAIMENHKIEARTEVEDRLLSGEVDPHKVNEVRGLIVAALDESPRSRATSAVRSTGNP